MWVEIWQYGDVTNCQWVHSITVVAGTHRSSRLQMGSWASKSIKTRISWSVGRTSSGCRRSVGQNLTPVILCCTCWQFVPGRNGRRIVRSKSTAGLHRKAIPLDFVSLWRTLSLNLQQAAYWPVFKGQGGYACDFLCTMLLSLSPPIWES